MRFYNEMGKFKDLFGNTQTSYRKMFFSIYLGLKIMKLI